VTPAGEFRELLARRQVEMAFVLPTVVINDPRVQLVGPLPAELQSPTEFMFAAGLSPQAKEPGAGRALLDYLLSPDALRVLRAKGLDGP
jgi:molybdate transport system substrate-binding protein